MKLYFFLIFFSVLLSACAGKKRGGAVDFSPRENTREMAWEQVQWRSQIIQDVKYDMTFEFDKKSESFKGDVAIQFNLNNNTHPLTVDFRDGKVEKVWAAGNEVTGWTYNGFFISLPAAVLQLGLNTIRVQYTAPFSKSGSGLYRSVDNTDSQVYLYTDFQPFDANMLFPSFDQPDLKATYKVQVTAPRNWTVITSVTEEKIQKISGGKSKWLFPESARYSTYIFPLHAGPYKVWSDKAEDIPIRVFARRSVAPHVKVKDWMTFTKQGFKFFNSYFDYKYPFQKYDQVIVPDFNSGAMENVAAVTFSESRFVRRGEKSRAHRRYHAEVVLHEMAHMWFGDLVSPIWWNGLWLNESFATYMAALSMYEATEFKEAWGYFFSSDKGWAYWEDQNVTTHPIELPVPTTGDAFANFDGITYGKGASVLKQLAFYVGADNFQKGVQSYFKKYAYQNTTIDNFLDEIGKAANTDLTKWANTWLRTSGLNTLTADFDCKEGKISEFDLLQGVASGDSEMRPHRTRVATFVQKANGQLKKDQIVDVAYDSSSTSVSGLEGADCPVLVQTNYEDYDYHKQVLDPVSLATVKKYIGRIEDRFTRHMMWSTLISMVHDGRVPASDFLQLARNNIGQESDPTIVSDVTKSVRSMGLYYLPSETAAEKELNSRWRSDFEDFYWTKLRSAEAGSELQKIWYSGLVQIAQSKRSLRRLERILKGSARFSGLKIDQDRRWDIVSRLNKFDYPGSPRLLAREKRRDQTTRGQKEAIAAEAIRPFIDLKEKWWAEATKLENRMTVSELNSAMASLFPEEQRDLHLKFADRFYQALPKLAHLEPQFLRRFAQYLAPRLCSEETASRLKTYAAEKAKTLPVVVIKKLRVEAQEDGRCVKARNLVRETLLSTKTTDLN